MRPSSAIDPAQIAVGGDGGGNLAAAADPARPRARGPQLSFQLLIYPATDSGLDTPVTPEFARGYMLTRCRNPMVPEPVSRSPRGRSKLLGLDSQGREPHAGSPPACVITAEFDPLSVTKAKPTQRGFGRPQSRSSHGDSME